MYLKLYYHLFFIKIIKLKPFVSVHTPQIDKKVLKNLQNINDWKNESNFGKFL